MPVPAASAPDACQRHAPIVPVLRVRKRQLSCCRPGGSSSPAGRIVRGASDAQRASLPWHPLGFLQTLLDPGLAALSTLSGVPAVEVFGVPAIVPAAILFRSAITSSTGARRCETCSSRWSIRPSRPPTSYPPRWRRKLRSHMPISGPASACVNQPAFLPTYASSNPILRSSCSNSVRLISCPLPGTMTTGHSACYKTGQIIKETLNKPSLRAMAKME